MKTSDASSKQLYAVKEMRPKSSRHCRLAINEAKVLHQCNHRALIFLYNACLHNNAIYLVMDYLPSGCLFVLSCTIVSEPIAMTQAGSLEEAALESEAR